MLLDRASFAVAAACSNDPMRPELSCILIQPDGSTVATNGHILVKVGPVKVDEADFPALLKFDTPAAPLPSSILISKEDAAKLERAIPKGKVVNRLPILGHALLDTSETNANGSVALHVTDLDSPQKFSCRKGEGAYPDYAKVLPTSEPSPVTRICFNWQYLKTLCEIAEKAGAIESVTHGVVLEFRGERAAIVVKGRGTSTPETREFTAIMMPLILPEETT